MKLTSLLTIITLASLLLIASAAIAAPTVFSVDKYGAKGDGVSDDGPAVRKAVSDAVALGKPAQVVFSKGKSYFLAYDSASPTLAINKAQDLEVDGKGAMLLLQAPESAFAFTDCKRCVVRGLTIEYPKLPYTQGNIVAVDPGKATFDLALMPGYDPPASGPADQWWISILGPTGHGLKPTVGSFLFLQSVEAVEGLDRIYRITVKPSFQWDLRNVAVGDRSFLPTDEGVKGFKTGMLFNMFLCSDITFENITIYTSPCMCFRLFFNTGKINFKGVRILNRPGTNRVMSSRSDGIHCHDNRVGPTIENCVFEGLMDDSIHIYCAQSAVVAVQSDTNIIATQRADNYAVGDTIQAYDSVSGKILGNATIASMSRVPQGISLVLSTPIAGIGVDPTAKVPRTVLYNISRSGSGFVIRNNTFLEQRGNAALIRAHDGLIEGNSITGGAGIYLGNDVGNWANGPVPDNVVIRNNKFFGSPGITLRADCSKPSAHAIQNIVLEGNQFTNLVRWPISIANAHHVTMTNTTIRRTDGQSPFAPIAIRNSDEVSINAPLTIIDPSAKLPALVQIDSESDDDMATIHFDWPHASISAPALKPDQYVARH